MKKIIIVLLVISSFVSNFALAKDAKSGETKDEEQLLEFLAEDKIDFGIEENAVLERQAIVLDIDGNILLKVSLEYLIQEKLSISDQRIIGNSELIMDNFGDKIFVLSIK